MSNSLISVCKPGDIEYPGNLLELKTIPACIYYKGDIEILNNSKSIAVIGSRHASEAGMDAAKKIGSIVGSSGVNLVNGLAVGCDTAALYGALDAGGKCVAILPCGLDRIYPKSNQALAERILENGGCLISEYDVGTPIQKFFFTQRDRLQSGVCSGVIVVETGEKGGTMHTVTHAIRQHRHLACYYSELLHFCEGNKKLLDMGKAERLENASDVEEFVGRVISEQKYEQLSLFN